MTDAPDTWGWTPERKAELAQLWEDGLSTPKIGRRLGCSKNAVVGQAHRLGLSPRKKPAAIARAERARAREVRAAAAPGIASTRTPQAQLRRELKKHEARGGEGGHSKTIRAGFSAPLSDDGCRFIEGDPHVELVAGRDPFCNAPRQEDSSYCPKHHRRCHVRTPPKRLTAAA